jgi:RNA polymerase sigma-70 factor (ECF subfamily)
MAMSATDKSASNLEGAHDVDLAALAKGGNRRAYGQLVRRHGSAVRGLVRRVGIEPGLADIIARDAFLDAYERIGDFRAEVPFQSWVKQIAARLCARRLRREAGEVLLAGPVQPERDTPPAGFEEALSRLPGIERLCVGLCYGGGLSHMETADALNLPPDTVKSHVGRGLDRLRAQLSPPPDGARRPVDG